MILAFQGPMVDPLAYGGASWGVLGALVFVIVVLGAIVYNVFTKGSAAAREREDKVLDFVAKHSDKTADVLRDLGDKIQKGDERIAGAMESQAHRVAGAMENQARMLRSVLLTVDALQRARVQKAGNGTLTTAEIETIIRFADDATRRGSG